MMVFKLVISRQSGAAAAAAFLAEHICASPIISIGSDPAATIQLDGSGVAAEQLIILLEDATPLLINRAAGTRLNDEPLNREARRPLAFGDTLRFGFYVVTLQNADDTNSTDDKLLIRKELEAASALPEASVSASAESALSPPAVSEQAPKNFAAILDSLRTEEDSFYFHFELGAQAGTRLLIDRTETLCGWDISGTRLTFVPAEIEVLCMIVRKDWTGVVVEPLAGGSLQVNDESLGEPRRLRNGERVRLVAKANASSVVLVFHEPASLVALDTLLPQPLPPPVTRALAIPSDATEVATALVPIVPAQPQAKRPRLRFDWERRYFGYFTLLELGIMAIFTLVAAVIIFLVLQYA